MRCPRAPLPRRPRLRLAEAPPRPRRRRGPRARGRPSFAALGFAGTWGQACRAPSPPPLPPAPDLVSAPALVGAPPPSGAQRAPSAERRAHAPPRTRGEPAREQSILHSRRSAESKSQPAAFGGRGWKWGGVGRVAGTRGGGGGRGGAARAAAAPGTLKIPLKSHRAPQGRRAARACSAGVVTAVWWFGRRKAVIRAREHRRLFGASLYTIQTPSTAPQ
jgi:hypothetical protein